MWQYPGRALSRGFTLIELIIAVGVVTLLMSLALPSFGEAVARARLKAAAEDLALDLGAARLESLRPGAVPLQVSVQPGTSWCWSIGPLPQSDCRGSAPGAFKVVRAEDYPGITMTTGASTLFDGREGLAPTSLSAEFVSMQAQTLRVHLTPLGRASVCAQGARFSDFPRC